MSLQAVTRLDQTQEARRPELGNRIQADAPFDDVNRIVLNTSWYRGFLEHESDVTSRKNFRIFIFRILYYSYLRFTILFVLSLSFFCYCTRAQNVFILILRDINILFDDLYDSYQSKRNCIIANVLLRS